MADLNKTYLFRMTHIQNIPHILQYGITHLTSPNANVNYVPIGDGSLINTRSSFILNNGKQLGDYIPFYFGVLTPMLYVIQKGYNDVKVTPAEDIVYCVSSVQQITDAQLDFVFTDGHAIETLSSQYAPIDVNNIDTLLDFKAINDWKFKDPNDLDKKRRKQAEFLVDGDVPKEAVIGFIVYNNNAQDKLLAMGIEEKKTKIKTGYYF
jgi:hypothetical protein